MPKRSSLADRRINASNRTRAYAACTECRRRKRKCDGNEPCSSCKDYGYPCSFNRAADSTARSPSVSQPQPVPENTATAHQAPSAPDVLASRERGRLINAHSAVAYPHLVGREIDAAEPPRLHSYAWNLGLRQERRGIISTALSDYLTLGECRELSATYFESIHTFFSFLHRETYMTRLEQNWASLEQTHPNFAAVVAGVAALGSFFSNFGHAQEDNIKRHCVAVLDLACSTPTCAVDLDSVAGWILRTLYARLTTRPAVACLASHTAMHMAEMTGLHASILEIHVNSLLEKAGVSHEDSQIRKRHYWAASFLNHLLSTEYGTTSINLPVSYSPHPNAQSGGQNEDELASLTRILGALHLAPKGQPGSKFMDDCLLQLTQIPNSSPISALFKAEVCLCILRQSSPTLAGRNCNPACVPILQHAVQSIPELLIAKQPWWCLPSVPFQTICVCLAADTPLFLSLLPTAMDALRSVATTFDSHMTREALRTAQGLIEASREKTTARLSFKELALGNESLDENISWLPGQPDMSILDTWPLELDFIPYFE